MQVLKDEHRYCIESFVPARLAFDVDYLKALEQRLTDLMYVQGWNVTKPAEARVLTDDETGDCDLRLGYRMVMATVEVAEFDVEVDPDEPTGDVRIQAPVGTVYNSGI